MNREELARANPEYTAFANLKWLRINQICFDSPPNVTDIPCCYGDISFYTGLIANREVMIADLGDRRVLWAKTKRDLKKAVGEIGRQVGMPGLTRALEALSRT